VGYYAHTTWGGLKLLSGRHSVAALLEDPQTAPGLKARLDLATRARDFASAELGLPDNKSYRKYKHLDRSFATWTVVVAPELSIQPVQWCFPIAGCVSYRGYFSRTRAEKFAAKWEEKRYDVEVGGVRAYSTLGWFADPLLSTFIQLPEPELVGLIFHELAHQHLYVKGDTEFNESFATMVELVGVQRWIESKGREELQRDFVASVRQERDFANLVRTYRTQLDEVYSQERDDEWKREHKQRLLQQLRDEYDLLRQSWGEMTAYDSWFDEGLNNARLASVGAYYDHVPAFCALLERCSGSLVCFFEQAEALADRGSEERKASLERLADESPETGLCSID
jgi:predicted aminopeptidase